jgi:hypothetical protein
VILRGLLIFLALLFVAAILRLLWLRYRPSPGRLLATLGAAALLAVLAWGAVTGRLHWLVAAPAALLPFARQLARLAPVLSLYRRFRPGAAGPGRARGTGTGRSTMDSRFLSMTLDHASGMLSGVVRDGPHAGDALDDLDRDTLGRLLTHYRKEDPDSARLLETYLERRFGSAGAEQADRDEGARGQAPPEGGPMTRQEALAILGLTGTPDRDAIVRAHRRLMQKCHPDHGGSDHLAAMVNQARDRLLDDLGKT